MAALSELFSPQELFLAWEREPWSSQEIDLTGDPASWAALDPAERDAVLWALSSLIVAEERITTQFTGLVLAADDEEETSYLASQQVDEARHLQFYARFQNEVVADPDAIAAHVTRAREHLGDPFRRIFDEALVQAHEKLVADPRDRAAKVEFVTTYHQVIEGTLGTTAFRFITQYLNEHGMVPGFVDGYRRIARDEQRHIAYGTGFLKRAVEEDADNAGRIRATLHALLPAVAEALEPPPNADGDGPAFGIDPAEVRAFALDGLTRRLTVIGAAL
ncbi:MAG: ribonucleoside-diphosphate reductase beta chain [Solirubrobacteraceae bacterium]|jgi:ribonucleoside-diphosphate reductase beta chain|nr:ribonucleoside-diphosphate reductase beta chain [Solirubrobacteraceae bacterium]